MFHVSSASIHSVPLSQGDEEQSSGGGMTIGKRKCENGKLIAHPLAAHLYRPLRPSGTSPSLGEESGGMPNGKVKTENGKEGGLV